MAYCNNYGFELEPGMKFCSSCGTPVPAAVEQDQPVEPMEEAEQPLQQDSSYIPPAPQQGSYTPSRQYSQGSYTTPCLWQEARRQGRRTGETG